MASFIGGPDPDSVAGTPDDDDYWGRGGPDLLGGAGGSDQLHGEEGNDELDGGPGTDWLDGGPGDDFLVGTWGDLVEGGADRDNATLDFRGAPAGIVADFRDGSGTEVVIGSTTLRGIESIFRTWGTAWADTIVVGEAEVFGEGGDDVLVGDAAVGGPELRGGDGNDLVDLRAAAAGIGFGDDGNDNVVSGPGSHDLFGGAGDDMIHAGGGNDSVDAGDGNDLVLASGVGITQVQGGAGDDVVYFGASWGERDFAMGSPTNASNDTLVLQGTYFGLEMRGVWPDPAGPAFFGATNFKTFRLLGTSDATYGGQGTATGYDIRILNNFADHPGGMLIDASGLAAGEFLKIDASLVTTSTFTMRGGAGGDTLIGGQLDDTFYGGAGADQVDGKGGFDFVRYDVAGANGLTAALFAPELNTGHAAGDTYGEIEGLVLTAGNDWGYGDHQANILRGLGGRDALYGQDGDDTVEGGDDHDLLWGGLGADFLDGGNGFDYARYDDATFPGMTVALFQPSLNTGAAAGDTYAGIEGLILGYFDDRGYGSNDADYLYGIHGNDQLYGQGGDDNVYGGSGNDLLWGGLGADLLDGGDGFDYARYDDATFPGLVASLANPGINTGAAAGDTYAGLEGLILGFFDDTGHGSHGAYYLYGINGNDTLCGEGGDDHLDGGGGLDRLSGGAGHDWLTGGGGADAFRFDSALNAGTNVDTIVDMAPGQDRIELDSALFTALSAGALPASAFRSGSGVTAAADADDRILFDTATGSLYYDADGIGAVAAVWFAVVLFAAPGLQVTAADFVVV